MSDRVENNSQDTAVHLGTISYDSPNTTFNIYETDSLSWNSDEVDYFTLDTVGIDELKIDIHPVGLTGEYYYKMSIDYYGFGEMNNIDEINLYGTNGDYYDDWLSYDDYDATNQSFINSGFTHLTGSGHYYYKENPLHNNDTLYEIINKTQFNHSIHPHLTIKPNYFDDTVSFYVTLEHFETYTNTGRTFGEYDLSYVIDITPISGENTPEEENTVVIDSNEPPTLTVENEDISIYRHQSASTIFSAADNDGTIVSIDANVDSSKGVVVVNNNSITYTPSANFSGTAQITLTVMDDDGATDTQQINVAVTISEAEQHLAQFGISMDLAEEFFYGFIVADTQFVYDVCLAFEITNDMVAQILGLDWITGEFIADFFTSQELDGNALWFREEEIVYEDYIFNPITNSYEGIVDVGDSLNEENNILFGDSVQTFDGAVKGSVDQNDNDVYAFVPTATGQMQFNLERVNGDCELILYNSNGVELETTKAEVFFFDDEDGFTYNVTNGETYYLEVYSDDAQEDEYIVSMNLPEQSSLINTLAGNTFYTGIYNTPETMGKWVFSEDGIRVQTVEMYGYNGELSWDYYSVDITDNAIIIDMGEENLVFDIVEITDEYLSYTNPYTNQLSDTGRFYYSQEEAEEYYTLSEEWFEGNDLYWVEYNSIDEEGEVFYDHYQSENRYTYEGIYNATATSIGTFEVDSEGLVSLSFTSGSFKIGCTSEDYFAFNVYLDNGYSKTVLYFYDEEEAIAYAEALTEPIQVICDFMQTTPTEVVIDADVTLL